MAVKITDIDDEDKAIVRYLSHDASITNANLGKLIGLSPSAVHERVRKLKQQGILKKIVACIDSEFMDMSLCSFIYVRIDETQDTKNFIDAVLLNSPILECHHITGDYSYLLKIRVKDLKNLETFITAFMKNFPNITKIKTEIVLSSMKEGSIIVGA